MTRSGLIKLLYQNPDSRWTEISTELKNAGYSDRLLTHAALVTTQGSLYFSFSPSILRHLASEMLTDKQSRYNCRYPFGMPEDLRLPCSHLMDPFNLGSQPTEAVESLSCPKFPFYALQCRDP